MPRRPDCPCAGCGALLWSGTTSLPAGERRCRACRAARRAASPPGRIRPERVCEWCRACFRPTSGKAHRTCSFSCGQKLRNAEGRGFLVHETPEARAAAERERWQRKNRRRRAQKRSAGTEPYSLAEIAARDGYRCGLCRVRVEMTKRVPHPHAPVVDHVVPLARGGSDLRVNVQLAHYRCNGIKGAAGGGEQLALIG
jgi:5-methylcytosine-specific restriction endonuclease McrA